MRCIITLPHFHTNSRVPATRNCFIIVRIAGRLRSALDGLLAASLILAVCTVTTTAAYGASRSSRPATLVQGSSSRKAAIDIRTSPSVYIPGPTFKAEVFSTKPITPRVPESLLQSIEQTLLRQDPRLRLAQTSGDTWITCTIVDFGVSPGVENRTRQEYTKIGETTATDPATGMSRTEDQYGYVDVPYRALVFEGRMSVKCEVLDVASGMLFYADRFEAVYSDAREVGAGSAPSVDDLNNIYLRLADNAAGLILVQLCPQVYSEIVALSSGKLKDVSQMMESSRWSEALISLSGMPAFKDPKDDAYRFYSIGVANEALAYKILDPVERKRQLERAVDSYRQATEMKPTENMFWAPKNRAEVALWQTGGLVSQLEVFEEAKKSGSKAAISPDQIATGNTDLFRQIRSRMQSNPTLINNQTVVEWVKAGRSSDYIAASIRHASGTQFDLSDAEVLKLRREGVNKSVLRAMAESQQGGRPGVSGRTRAVITAMSLLWWLPFVFGR